MYTFEIDGSEYRLIPFDKDRFMFKDSDKYKLWMNDPIVTKFNSHGLFAKTDKEINDWLADMDAKHTLCFMLLNPAGEWIGVISLQSFNWIYRSAEVALWIGDTNSWGKGLATHMVYLMCIHGFERLNLNRIWSGTAETNRGMQKAFERNGFRKEGVFRQGMFLSGRYADIFCYSMLAKDWQEKDYVKADRQ